MSRLEETALEALAGKVAEELPEQLAEALGCSGLSPEVVDQAEELIATEKKRVKGWFSTSALVLVAGLAGPVAADEVYKAAL